MRPVNVQKLPEGVAAMDVIKYNPTKNVVNTVRSDTLMLA